MYSAVWNYAMYSTSSVACYVVFKLILKQYFDTFYSFSWAVVELGGGRAEMKVVLRQLIKPLAYSTDV